MSTVTEVHINHERATCQVFQGVARRALTSTPLAVALALISEQLPDAAEQDMAPSGRWTDMLATHGVACGRVNGRDVTLALIPSKVRTFSYRPDATSADMTALFPPLLMGLATRDGRYTQGCLYVCDLAQQSRMSVISDALCLHTFPYGNVYDGTGKVCWGQVQHGSVATIAEMETLFFNSGFNTDLFQAPSATARDLATVVTAARGAALPCPAMTQTIPTALGYLTRS